MAANMVFIAKGHTFLGQTTRDADGNVVKHTAPHFEFAEDGGSVAVGLIDCETEEVLQNPPPTFFGDYDPAGYLAEALRLLNPKRKGNIPNFKEITMRQMEEYHSKRCPYLDFCDANNCSDCIVTDWIEEELM